VAGIDAVAHLRQLDIDEIAQKLLRAMGDADGHAAVFLDARPFVAFEELQIARYLGHVGCFPGCVEDSSGCPNATATPMNIVETFAQMPGRGLPLRTKGASTRRTGT